MKVPALTFPSFYDRFEEHPLGGASLGRRRKVDGFCDPEVTLEAAENSEVTNYAWWKARELEGRTDTSPAEGVWGINYWRAERYFGDPTRFHLPDWHTEPNTFPPGIEKLARRFRLHHYFRVWSSEECLHHVAKGEEVRFGVEVTEEWHNPPNGVIGDAQGLIALGSHAVPIVDYDYETSRFVFPNSWGPGWGRKGWGSLSRQYFDQRIVEGWCRVGAGIFPPIASTSGLVCLLWKSAAGGGEVHGREIVDAGSGDRLAWAFAVRQGDHLDVEELFVWPTFRRRGYARKLAELLRELAAAMSLQLRAWIPFADCDSPNRSGLVRTLELLGLNLHPSPHRSAGFVAVREQVPVPLLEPRIPVRPASTREALNPEAGTRLYTVWYGTNRKPVDAADPASGFSHERDEHVHYGKCQVAIPRSHKFGSVGSSWWRRWVRLTDDRLHIVDRTAQSPEDFWADIRSTLESYPGDERQALIFLHGYRVQFDRAAIRAAQLGFDLKVPGVTAFFSWPSRGLRLHYPGDGEAIQASEAAITDFIVRFVRESGATLVHLVG